MRGRLLNVVSKLLRLCLESLAPLVDRVEKGIAPDTIPASAPATSVYFPGRTRPLCVFPKYARYEGTGNIEDASSFSCIEN